MITLIPNSLLNTHNLKKILQEYKIYYDQQYYLLLSMLTILAKTCPAPDIKLFIYSSSPCMETFNKPWNTRSFDN